MPHDFCFVLFDQYPNKTSWDVQKANSNNNFVLVESYEVDDGESSAQSLFLLEGEYQFTIYDSAGDGLCCGYGEGSYNVTLSGQVIAQGGEFGFDETMTFWLPFDLTM